MIFKIKNASQNFNPRLREGGDNINLVPVQSNTISIHASAKEATCHAI